jgi:hypothetical protein
MNRGSALAACIMTIGGILLYLGWANIDGLIPPYALCNLTSKGGIHLGDNLAVVYNEGCTPYKGAFVAFFAISLAGITNLIGGYHFFRECQAERVA